MTLVIQAWKQQNTKVVILYEKMDFKTYQRTGKEDQGKEYPLLRIKL